MSDETKGQFIPGVPPRPFTKGGPSPNPGGRSKIEKHLRELLKDDLDEIAKCQASIAKGVPPKDADGKLTTDIKTVSARESTRASEWIYDRCFGRPKQNVKLEGDVPTVTVDWSKLPIEKQRELIEMYERLGLLGETQAPTEH